MDWTDCSARPLAFGKRLGIFARRTPTTSSRPVVASGPEAASPPPARRWNAMAAAVLAIVCGIIVWSLYRPRANEARLVSLQHCPQRVMGTTCEITVVVQADQRQAGGESLRAAESALRDIEARMSVFLEGSEMWNLNSARAGQKVPLSPPVMDVLGASREIHAASNGAFDITVLPLVRLWKQAGKDNRLPSAVEIAAARNSSSWEQIELLEGGALKRSDSACLDLGGIAKGYAVDRAVEILRAKGARGGVVNLGGNLRCFGRREDGRAWEVAVLDPFGVREGNTLLSLEVGEAAVCTSAHYHRYAIIGGKNYSHILNPSTGWPAGDVASATVVAPTCMQADGWATALCVLGVEGFKLLPAGAEAMLVVGTPSSHTLRMTEGFRKFLPPEGKGN